MKPLGMCSRAEQPTDEMNLLRRMTSVLALGILGTVSCAPMICMISGKPCKKIRLQDESGRPIESATAGGDPMSPAIMNSSDSKGHLVLSKHWADRDTGIVTIKAGGFIDLTKKFDDIPPVVVLKRAE